MCIVVDPSNGLWAFSLKSRRLRPLYQRAITSPCLAADFVIFKGECNLHTCRDAGQDSTSQLAAWAVLDRCLASGVAQFRERLALEMVMQRFVLDAGSNAVRC